jgi:MtN3 and saliva related transmembrane protein
MEKIISGSIAAVMGVLSFTPQLVHAYKTKKTEDISWLFIWCNLVMSIVWAIYGYYAVDWVVIITDVLIGIQVVLLMGLKFHYDKKNISNRTVINTL